MKNEILLIPDKADIERDALTKIWSENGGEVKRIGKFWIKPETKGKRITLYGHDSFCLVLAQILNLNLISPKDEIIAELEERYVKREIYIKLAKKVSDCSFPKFIKPVKPKLFQASVFKSVAIFQEENEGLDATELLICSDVIHIEKEVRAFILNHSIEDLAFYEGEGSINSAKVFINDFLENCELALPHSFVLDIGYNESHQWFIIEFNSSWGAGLNFCNPQKVINCIREATNNQFNQSL